MKHVQREVIEATVSATVARLDKVIEAINHSDDPLRDVAIVMARHCSSLGQDEVADKLFDFVIGYTNPTPCVKVPS